MFYFLFHAAEFLVISPCLLFVLFVVYLIFKEFLLLFYWLTVIISSLLLLVLFWQCVVPHVFPPVLSSFPSVCLLRHPNMPHCFPSLAALAARGSCFSCAIRPISCDSGPWICFWMFCLCLLMLLWILLFSSLLYLSHLLPQPTSKDTELYPLSSLCSAFGPRSLPPVLLATITNRDVTMLWIQDTTQFRIHG